MNQRRIQTSRFLSLVLRHRPEAIGQKLDPEGWLEIEQLLASASERGRSITLTELHEVVQKCEKQRFAISDDGLRIRANQGHSVSDVQLNLAAATPPDVLYHGTVRKFIQGIRREGLRKRSRNHVHLSLDEATAIKVGSRRGEPVILTIHAGQMHDEGHDFYLSANSVWLTEEVPPNYIQFPDES